MSLATAPPAPETPPARRRLRFTPKLRLALLWPALAALATVTALLLVAVPRIFSAASTRELLDAARLVAPALQVPPSGPYTELQRQVGRLAAGTSMRLTVVALDGTVLADSDQAPEGVGRMENHRDRPEIAAALARGEGTAVRHSATIGADFVYAARLVAASDGRQWIVRLSQPIAALAELKRHFVGVVLLAALAAMGAMGAISWWLHRTLFRPLTDLIAAAQELGDGDFAARFEIPGETELATLGAALSRIARRAREQIAALAAERDHLHTIVDSLADGVMVTDRDGRADTANPIFRELLGHPAPVAGLTLREVSRHPALSDLVERVRQEGGRHEAQVELSGPRRRIVDLRATALADGGGTVVVARDVTDVEQLHRTRRDFVANVSHELKTPLAAIRGSAETLEDGALDDPAAARSFLARILDQCARLESLVSDLLMLSRLETAERTRALERVDLAELVHEVAERFADAAAARGVTLAVAVEGDGVVSGEADALERMLANLADNAVKHGRPGGHVTLEVEGRAGEVALRVRDDGPGIPGELLPRVFERFFRIDGGRDRTAGGSGLGLAIVKHTALAHGGTVDVESTPGRGSTFHVRLPRLSPAG